ncbi:major histocompatibility complex class I UXA2 precursor [Silurus meridionalis]|nr:major histocompatibility complex class I UXA2 precursor [Silurus meridionalis]
MLQYHTVVSSQNATTTVELDGETIAFYSSSDAEVILKTEWIKKIDGDVQDYWKSEKSRMSGDHLDLQHHLSGVEELLHQTKGAPTLTRTYTCEISDDIPTRGSLQILYDGEDFIRLNLSSGTWTADNHQAEQFLNAWKKEAEYWTHYLNHRCIKSLKQYLTYRNSVNQGVSWVEDQVEEQMIFGDVQFKLNVFVCAGAPTLTRTYTCEIIDDHTTGGSLQILYDGEDFIRLNLSSGTWTADNHQAEQFLKAWEHAERNAIYWTHYLNHRCNKSLKQYLTYRNSVNQGVSWVADQMEEQMAEQMANQVEDQMEEQMEDQVEDHIR